MDTIIVFLALNVYFLSCLLERKTNGNSGLKYYLLAVNSFGIVFAMLSARVLLYGPDTAYNFINMAIPIALTALVFRAVRWAVSRCH